jgi:putative superfamily III holin-X
MDPAPNAAPARESVPEPETATTAATVANDGLIDNAVALWNDLQTVAHDHVELAALEAKRAGQSLVAIVVYGVVIAILAVTAWMGIVTAGVLWLIQLGLNASLAVLIGVVVNLAGAFGLVLLIKQASQALRFPATVRALKPSKASAAEPPTPTVKP